MNESVLDRLQNVHPDLEMWWDSSALVFESWVKKMVDAAPPAKKALMDEWLNRIYVLDDPGKSMVRGCTTNPPLSLTAVKNDPATWNEWIDDLISSNHGLTQHEYFWFTYREVITRGAKMMLPIWEATEGRYGYISGQLDPRLITETEKMIEMAKERKRRAKLFSAYTILESCNSKSNCFNMIGIEWSIISSIFVLKESGLLS